MNMYLHELKSLRKSTIIWVCVMAAIAAIYLSMFPQIAKDATGFKEILSGYPPAVQAMLGIAIDSIASLLGFYGMVITFVMLLAAIQAMNWGVAILSKESRERTADFLLTKPVSRSSIVTAKVTAALTMLVVTNVVYYAAASALVAAANTDAYNARAFFLINLSVLLVQLVFFSLGVFISVFFQKLRSVLPVSLGVVFALYFIGVFGAAGESDGVARHLSPFKYFQPYDIVRNVGYDTPYMIQTAAIIVAALVCTYLIYSRKDIHSVS